MRKKFLFLTAVLLAVILLSGCTGGAVRGNTWPGLSASDNVAYLADGPFVYAVNLENGTELWRYPAQRDNKLLFYTTPYVTPDGLIIVGSSGSDASLLALKPNGNATPSLAWSYSGAKDHWVAAPLQIDNKLFAPNSDGNLYILDLRMAKRINSRSRSSSFPRTCGRNPLPMEKICTSAPSITA